MILPFTPVNRQLRLSVLYATTLLVTLTSFTASQAQNCFVNPRIKKITANISPAIQSYLEYKPLGYDSTTTKKYPLLIYIGGTGEMFQQPGGTDQDLCPALQYSMPWRMNVGHFPDVVKDNDGREFSYFVVMPFVKQWEQQYNIDPGAVIDYMLQRYAGKLDPDRIYLTAMSRGTDNIMGYVTGSSNAAKRIAAIVPVANCFPANVGTATYNTQVSNLANGNVHMWGISCTGDIPCTEKYIQNWTKSLDSVKPGNGLFTYATFACDTEGPNASHHYAWNSAYDPDYRVGPGNKNVYEWMIQFTKGSAGPPPPPPVVPDCNNINIITTANSIKLKGLIAPVITVQIFNKNWSIVYNQFFNNSPDSIEIPNLSPEIHHLKVSFYTSSWSLICEKVQDATVGGTDTPPPPIPPPTGTPDCNKITMMAVAGGIQLSGLTAPVVGVQVFNGSWATVYNRSFTNSPGTVTIPSLPAGTYHVKVNFSNASWAAICEKMQDVIVTTGAAPNTTAYANEAGMDMIQQPMARNIAVAPNPIVNTLYVTVGSNKNENGIITVVDLQGRELVRKSVNLQNGMNRFSFDDLSKQNAGSYILRLTTKDGVQNVRLIKQ